jgi:hypothetical protein
MAPRNAAAAGGRQQRTSSQRVSRAVLRARGGPAGECVQESPQLQPGGARKASKGSMGAGAQRPGQCVRALPAP